MATPTLAIATPPIDALVTVNGLPVAAGQPALLAPVLSGSLDMPESGRWTSHFEVDAPAPPLMNTTVQVVFAPQAAGDPAVTYTGTCLWNAPWQGRSKFWMVGGAGRLHFPVVARNYVATAAPIRLTDLLAAILKDSADPVTGRIETLDPTVTVDPSLTLGQWQRPAGTGMAALSSLLGMFGLTWRFNPTGTIWIGALAYPAEPSIPYVVDPGDDGVTQCFVVTPDMATLAPATTILGRAVNRVVYEVGGSALRTTCYYGQGERADWEAAVRTLLPELPTLASYEATVVTQRASGLLEVICDDARMGALDNVLMLAGGPASRFTMQQGDRVRILFASGKPQRYYAIGCEQDPTATAGVARVGDTTADGTLSATSLPGGGPVTFTYTAPGSNRFAVGPSVNITGVITSGSPRQFLKLP